MQKIVNPRGIIGSFQGTNISEITTLKGINKKTPITIQLRGSVRDDAVDLNQVDAFNVLDIFILSRELKELFDRYIPNMPCRKASVFFNGVALEKSFFIPFIETEKKIGLLLATEADWEPDANYPVDVSVRMDEHLVLDSELKFPVISEFLVNEIKSSGLNAEFKAYPTVPN